MCQPVSPVVLSASLLIFSRLSPAYPCSTHDVGKGNHPHTHMYNLIRTRKTRRTTLVYYFILFLLLLLSPLGPNPPLPLIAIPIHRRSPMLQRINHIHRTHSLPLGMESKERRFLNDTVKEILGVLCVCVCGCVYVYVSNIVNACVDVNGKHFTYHLCLSIDVPRETLHSSPAG